MQKLIGYIVVFLLGFAVAAYIYHTFPPVSSGSGKAGVMAQLTSETPSNPTGPNDIVNAVSKVEPAVVNIDTVGDPIHRGWLPDFFGEDSPFGMPEPVVPKGSGSGVIISKDGYIVTNNHVIADARKITVRLTGSDKSYAAKVIGADAKSDLAVIKIAADNLPFAQFGDSSKLRVGEWSIAIGNPLGIGTTVTVGVISATNRTNLQVDEGKVLERAIQTDAAINPGNSGGALANIEGRVIGINTAIASVSGGSIGIGFAIPANSAKNIIKELIEKGRVVRPWVGIQYQLLTPQLREQFRIPVSNGVIVADVLPNSPAAKAGIQVADVIVEIDRRKISKLTDVGDAIRNRKVGDLMTLRVYRDGGMRFITIRLGEAPPTYQ